MSNYTLISKSDRGRNSISLSLDTEIEEGDTEGYESTRYYSTSDDIPLLSSFPCAQSRLSTLFFHQACTMYCEGTTSEKPIFFFFFFRFPTNLPLDSSFLGTGASSWYSKKVTKL